VIEEMKHRNIEPVMITGDNKTVAAQIAKELGIETFYAEVLPKDKSNIVKTLGKDKVIAFVGDGVNDAPALEIANVGFAMGDGTDIAINSSDVTLLSNDLKLVIYAIDISNATLKNIYQNFLWAFSYNIVAIPLAALGYLSMALSASAMAFSSIMVVLNALRLKRFKLQKFNKTIEAEIEVITKDEGDNIMKIKVEDMSCGHCTAKITSVLEAEGAKNIHCDLDTKVVSFENVEQDKAVELVKEAGYNPEKI
jgi:Cu+-exporting ATPase